METEKTTSALNPVIEMLPPLKSQNCLPPASPTVQSIFDLPLGLHGNNVTRWSAVQRGAYPRQNTRII